MSVALLLSAIGKSEVNRLIACLNINVKGHGLSNHNLLLRQSNLFCISSTSNELLKEQSLLNKLRFYWSTCYISREDYWEHITHYPTTNLMEVYKISKAELPYISPIDGNTYAYIVNVSKNKTTVLYCCFSKKVIASAQSNKLWRLLPESLPYYRYFFDKKGIYHTCSNLTAFKDNKRPLNAVNIETEEASELLVKIDNDNLSSLPASDMNADTLSIAMLEDAASIDASETQRILNKFSSLKILDFSFHVIEYFTLFTQNKSYLARYLIAFFMAFIFTFMLGKSAFLVWNNTYLTDVVAESKQAAAKSIKLSNQLKQVKSNIVNINESINTHLPKELILQVLVNIVNKDNDIVFAAINVSSEEIQIRGTAKNASALLNTLSKISGFKQVEFNTPPATLRTGEQRFNININFDNKLKISNELNNG